jgi:hypothetical protein
MKRIFFSILSLLLSEFAVTAQQFDVDTLMYQGDKGRYINLVILGDGYTETQQDTFVSNAQDFIEYFFQEEPFARYKNYFNVFAIEVISKESGAKHPHTAPDCEAGMPSSDPDNYFGSTFDSYGIHRLVEATNRPAIAEVLQNNVPEYDHALILVNSPYYGGSGGEVAVSTMHAASFEIAVHELGHSFAWLADEYWAGAIYAKELPNMTQQNDQTLIKWKNWLHSGNSIGIYPHQEDPSWYRPHQSCKMRLLGNPFCSVCRETIIEKIHWFTNPVVAYSPMEPTQNAEAGELAFTLTELMKPEPNTLQINWTLDSSIIAHNSDSIAVNINTLVQGTHTLTVTVSDTSKFIRSDAHATDHISTVKWTIVKSINGIKMSSASNKVSLLLYPNPVANRLTIRVQSEKAYSRLNMMISTLDGKIVKEIAGIHNENTTVDVSDLSAGTYLVTYILDGESYSQSFMKE